MIPPVSRLIDAICLATDSFINPFVSQHILFLVFLDTFNVKVDQGNGSPPK
jgi:hypothetical protein